MPVASQASELESIYEEYLQAILQGDRYSGEQAVDRWLAMEGNLGQLYERLFRRALYQVGWLWENGEIAVATEHLATAITETMMARVYPRLLTHGPRRGAALVACTTDEYHQVGAKMVADLFELHSWHCHFLGAGTRISDYFKVLRERPLDAVALSAALDFHLDSLYATVLATRDEFPDLPILVGGQAFRLRGSERFEAIPGVIHLKSLPQLEVWLDAR